VSKGGPPAAVVEIKTVDPTHPDARRCVRSYFAELDSRSESGFDPATGISAEPHELRPPAGRMLVVYRGSEPIGCGAVKHHQDAPSEIKQRTLVATGGGGDFFEQAADTIAASLPQAERLTLEGQGHVVDPRRWLRCSHGSLERRDTVNLMVNDPFKALSHPIRRGIVERLAAGPATVGDATGGFGVSKPAISKHLKVLEETGVVRREVLGRTHRLSLEPDVLSEAADWMDRQRALWGRLFDVVDEYLKEEKAR
jgi:DNA-binding transcriptional ArsR family regulator